MTDQPTDWTIIRLLEWTRAHFAAKGIADARLEAELLLSHALGIERIQLYVKHDRVVGEPELSRFRELVKQRAQRVPTQYLLGRAWFRNLTLKVTPAVLIPRPETELLVDEALAVLCAKQPPAWQFDRGRFVELLRAKAAESEAQNPVSDAAAPQPIGEAESDDLRKPEKLHPLPMAHHLPHPAAESPCDSGISARVLDLCTGSGCIAIALASECPQCRVVATDLSAEALKVARENAVTAGVGEHITFFQGDLFAAIAPLPPEERLFNLISVNPPYISERAYAELMPEVREHEPRAALVGGPTGLEFIERILAEAPACLIGGGSLLLEIGFDQGREVRRLIAAAPTLELLTIRKDLGGHERVVHLRRKE
jgi:release factor glutamine methyltransferase